ncbi:MAG: hypothetical protein IJW36_00565, partial [Clostridia bacterium]|nr:hypothetical protein [Clostridia bacterium]
QTITKVDPETGELVEESKPFWEISIYNNAFELKFNEIFDENENAFYSRGLQYITKAGYDKVDFSVEKWINENSVDLNNYRKVCDITPYKESTKTFVGEVAFGANCYDYRDYSAWFMEAKSLEKMNIFEYQSVDGGDFIGNEDADSINEDTMFKLQIGEDIYGMKLKYPGSVLNIFGSSTGNLNYKDTELLASITEFVKQGGWLGRNVYYDVTDYYRVYDIHFLAEILYNAFKGLPAGTSQQYTIRMSDYFDYYKYNGKTYNKEKILDVGDALINYVNSNFGIQVNVFDYDLNSSAKSLFNNYKGNQNIVEDAEVQDVIDYKMSKTIDKVSLDDFDWVATDKVGEYVLKLSDAYKSQQTDLSMFMLDIELDITDFGITIKGINKQSLNGYEIYEATIIDNMVESEVVYV